LYGCLFQDGGSTFVDMAQQHSSPTKLTISEPLPLDKGNFVRCLDHLNCPA
jgi:hypothetical protein